MEQGYKNLFFVIKGQIHNDSPDKKFFHFLRERFRKKKGQIKIFDGRKRTDVITLPLYLLSLLVLSDSLNSKIKLSVKPVNFRRLRSYIIYIKNAFSYI